MPTQFERVQYIIEQNFRTQEDIARSSEQSDVYKELYELMGTSQNPPPEGASDGSIDETAWNALA